jgi:hypothetical protein
MPNSNASFAMEVERVVPIFLEKLVRQLIGPNGNDINQAIAYDYTAHPHPLLDMVDGHSVQIKLPATALIAAKCKASAFTDKRARLFDPHANRRHRLIP